MTPCRFVVHDAPEEGTDSIFTARVIKEESRNIFCEAVTSTFEHYTDIFQASKGFSQFLRNTNLPANKAN